jgi:hypothetical protein
MSASAAGTILVHHGMDEVKMDEWLGLAQQGPRRAEQAQDRTQILLGICFFTSYKE